MHISNSMCLPLTVCVYLWQYVFTSNSMCFTNFVEQKRCEGQISDGISWNTTLAGNTKYEHCPAKQRGDALEFSRLLVLLKKNIDRFFFI